ncbi:MAG: twin-arginine translocation signal domain-containing protein [Coriobacteriia bacterium]|nr:twin-arginine translocation signal domain-containing protein [Coriobacteriia bacterium]
MATRDTGQPASGITRRDFLKTTAAATAVAGCGLEFMYDPAKAAAYESSPLHTVTFTTCPYCSASCGQRVVKENASGKVVDIYGDFQSPWNSGGLCSKGAGTLQLVNNPRRIGAWTGAELQEMTGSTDHPVNNVFKATGSDVAYKRAGNDPWTAVPLAEAMEDIAEGLVAARGALSTTTYNQKNVAFFGSSHMNNEQNYLYRKLIATFGSSNVEHQARI